MPLSSSIPQQRKFPVEKAGPRQQSCCTRLAAAALTCDSGCCRRGMHVTHSLLEGCDKAHVIVPNHFVSPSGRLGSPLPPKLIFASYSIFQSCTLRKTCTRRKSRGKVVVNPRHLPSNLPAGTTPQAVRAACVKSGTPFAVAIEAASDLGYKFEVRNRDLRVGPAVWCAYIIPFALFPQIVCAVWRPRAVYTIQVYFNAYCARRLASCFTGSTSSTLEPTNQHRFPIWSQYVYLAQRQHEISFINPT